MIHIDYAPIKGCKNPDTYGVICYKCNKCHRFNPDWTCPLCGGRTRAMKSMETWRAIEIYDVFRLPICPDCQHYFTDAELGIGGDHPKTIPCHKAQLLILVRWRESKVNPNA